MQKPRVNMQLPCHSDIHELFHVGRMVGWHESPDSVVRVASLSQSWRYNVEIYYQPYLGEQEEEQLL